MEWYCQRRKKNKYQNPDKGETKEDDITSHYFVREVRLNVSLTVV
jgi:hypothetical protein